MAHKWEIYKDKAGEFRARFKYNGEIMFSTEGYSSKQSAQHAIDSAKKNMPDAEVFDNTGTGRHTRKTPESQTVKVKGHQLDRDLMVQMAGRIRNLITDFLVISAMRDPKHADGIIVDVWLKGAMSKPLKTVMVKDPDEISEHILTILEVVDSPYTEEG